MAKKSKLTRVYKEVDQQEGRAVQKTIFLYNIDNPNIILFEDSESYDDIKTRLRFVPPSSTTTIKYQVTEKNTDQFFTSILKHNDHSELLNRNIKITIKAGDMPQELFLFGDNISITNDYDIYSVKPALGNRVVFFPRSSVSFKGGEQLYQGIINPTIIEDNVIIGSGVHIPGHGMYIRDSAIVANLNDYMSQGLMIGEGAYIASGLKQDADAGNFNIAHNFYVMGPNNRIGRDAVIRGDVVLTGNIKIPPYAQITGNVPLIFSGINLESIYLRGTNQIDGTIYSKSNKGTFIQV